MARRGVTDLALGGRIFAVRPLTLGQVERIEDVLNRSALPSRTAFDVVATALSRDHADVALGELDGDANALARAAQDVVASVGFDEDRSPGEQPAAAVIAQHSGASCADAWLPPPG